MLERWLTLVLSHPDGLQVAGIVVRSAIIYLAIVFGMRLLGSRPLGRASAYDFILVVVIANSVQNALVGGGSTLFGGLASAFTLLAMNFLYTWLVLRFPKLEKGMVGTPIVIVNHGQAQANAMARAGVTQDELMAALRRHGLDTVNQVRLAVLEVDGSISVVPTHGIPSGHLRRRFKGGGET